jgi:hypothetical protein
MYALTNDQLRKYAPSVFATSPWNAVSDRYRFIPTSEIVELLRSNNFFPVRARQSRTRIAGKGDFTKHLVTFRHGNSLGSTQLNQEVPEILIGNSHDRACAVSVDFGIFRLVCTNGLVVKSAAFDNFKVRHTGDVDLKDQVIDATYRIVNEAPKVIEQIDAWKGVQLDRSEQMAFARAALPLLGNENLSPDQHANQLLGVRRHEDNKSDLWTTSNRIQENMLKGGVRYRGATGRRNTTREVKDIRKDVSLNKAIWALTEEMARLKS